VGTGGLCGSAFLNYRFEDHVRARLGAQQYEAMRQNKPKTWMTGLRFFEESVKRNFNPDGREAKSEEDSLEPEGDEVEDEAGDEEEINVPFPGLSDDEAAGLEDGFLSMTTQQVREIFDPVVNGVVALLEGQVSAITARDQRVSGIILVGGFGSSSYLYNRLKRHFTQPAIEVIQPLYAWTAVVRGAVLSGVEGEKGSGMVERRRSRRHYGTTYATVYDEHKHARAARYWSPLWERWMVSDRMQWHIAKVSHGKSTGTMAGIWGY